MPAPKFIYIYCCVSFSLISAYTMQEALTDLHYIYTSTLENHPGVYNAQDTHFREDVEQIFTTSNYRIENAYKAEEYISALIDFSKSFHDPHVRVEFYQQTSKTDVAMKQHRSFFMSELGNDSIWISLPTFAPNNDEQKTLHEIIKIIPTIRAHKLLIFDVRGNGGGNSYWSEKVIQTLFGINYAKNMIAKAHKDMYTEWRTSRNNIEFLTKSLPHFEQDFGKNGEATVWLKELINKLQYEHEQGNFLYAEKSIQSNENNMQDTIDPVLAKIMVIIDSGCGSACLDFIDMLKAMNHEIILFGQATNFDTVYMDICTVELPSKQGTFSFPMKVYRNRPRGNRTPYYPDIVFADDIKNTSLIMSIIKQDFY